MHGLEDNGQAEKVLRILFVLSLNRTFLNICLIFDTQLLFSENWYIGAPPWSNSSVLDCRSLPPMFESWCGHI